MSELETKVVSKHERKKRAHEIMDEEDQQADIGEQPVTTQAKQATAEIFSAWNKL